MKGYEWGTYRSPGVHDLVRAHLLDVVHFRMVVRERIDFRAHCLRPHDRVMAEPPNADDPDSLSRPAAVRPLCARIFVKFTMLGTR